MGDGTGTSRRGPQFDFDFHGTPLDTVFDDYRVMHQRCPVSWSDHYGGFWTLTRYEDVAFVSKNAEIFSSEIGTSIMSDMHPRDRANMQQQMINMDPPSHTELRKLMSPHFKPRTVAQTEEHTRKIVHDTLGKLVGETESISSTVSQPRSHCVP